MTIPSPQNVSQTLAGGNKDNPGALDQLMPLVYDELRRLARRYLRRERADHTLQPTALVHEAYLRIADQTDVRWQNRAHFFGIAAQSMRHILVEHARSHNAAKRGGGEIRLSLSKAAAFLPGPDVDLLALDDALNDLERMDPQKSRLIELRFFAGLTVEETAEALGISTATVTREWRSARAWLYRRMKKEAPHQHS